jgi:serine/threonine protein kinase
MQPQLIDRIDANVSTECQETNPHPMACYQSAPNDVWSLGVILVNLTCGRNPWKRASVEDSTYKAYRKDPNFLKTILPVTDECDAILRRIFDLNPSTRITLHTRPFRSSPSLRMPSSTTVKIVPSNHFRLPGTLPTRRSSTPARHLSHRSPPHLPLYIAHLNLLSIRRRFSRRHLASKRLWLPTHLSRHLGTAAVPTFLSSLLRSVLNPTGLLPTRPLLFSTFYWHGTMKFTTLLSTFY